MQCSPHKEEHEDERSCQEVASSIFGRAYGATVSGSTVKHVRCAGCPKVFAYVLERAASGRADSHYYLNNAGAAEKARQRARAILTSRLAKGLTRSIVPLVAYTNQRWCKYYGKSLERNLTRTFSQRCDLPSRHKKLGALCAR
jgi:hypothetical protein